MEILNIFSAFGLSASAGLNAYIPLLIVSVVGRFAPGLLKLNAPWDVMTSWWIIGLLVVLSLIEFFADKIPAVDSINDVIQTFVRPTAGAILFAASAHVVTDVHPILSLGLGLVVAGGVHAVKATARPVVTATTAGTANVLVSTAEDITATVLSILSVTVPILVAVLLIVISLVILWRILRKPSAPKV
jgi:hypothetical protein